MIYYRKRKKYKYVLEKESKYNVDIPIVAFESNYLIVTNDKCLVIKKGYAWDGATGIIDSKKFLEASLVHDALYQLMRAGKIDKRYKDDIDKMLKLFCYNAGTSKLLSWLIYMATKLFGSYFTKSEILKAP